ncbi:MAG TPA: hypothetical protein DCZ75_00570 [Geobacter sp.]|nr:hypothetical protein [Geobacter sp.]
METFDEAYANYRNFLAKLDVTDDISEKNQLFRQLTHLLSDLENRLVSRDLSRDRDPREKIEPSYWN